MNKIVVAGILVIVAFLAGFLPSYSKGKRLENELAEARQENRMAQLRDSACLVYLQASQNDYGLAAGASTLLFDRMREAADQMPDASARKSLDEILGLRDPITAKLAKGDPGALYDVQSLLVKTRQATEVSSGASQPE